MDKNITKSTIGNDDKIQQDTNDDKSTIEEVVNDEKVQDTLDDKSILPSLLCLEEVVHDDMVQDALTIEQ